MTKTESQNKYLNKYARPAILIDKALNDKYKAMVINKGYNSLNDYVNCLLKYDLVTDKIPYKEDIAQIIKEDIKAEQ